MAQLQAPIKTSDETASPENGKGVLVHNDKKYAVGLVWLTADDVNMDSGLAKQRARQLNADFYAVRATIAHQHGFGFLNLGHRMGMPAAASIAADTLVGEWHGMFTVDEGWWYIAVHADAVAPDGDRLFYSEEEAYNFFLAKSEGYRWPRSFSPEAWNIPDSSGEIPLDKLFEDALSPATLRPNTLSALFGGEKRKNLGLFIGLIVVCFLMVLLVLPMAVSDNKTQRIQFSPKIAMPSIIAAPPPEVTREQATGINYLDMRIPRPSAAAKLCSDVFEDIVYPLPGWDLTGVGCTIRNIRSASAEASWRKRVGSLEMVKSFVNQFPDDAAVSFNGSDLLSVRKNLGDLFKISLPIRVIERETAIRELYDRFGDLGQLQIVDRVPAAPPQKERGIKGLLSEAPPPQKPPYLEITLITQTPPNVLGAYFDLPGLKLQNITWSARSKSWSYKAELLFESQILLGKVPGQ